MFPQITSDLEVLGGKPCIKDTRISVEFLLELFASGATHQDLLEAYPQLTTEGITEALRYGARFLKNASILVAEVTAWTRSIFCCWLTRVSILTSSSPG